MLAILFGVFAPSVSHAFAATAAARDYVEICTAHGVQVVQVDTGHATAGDDGALARHAGHCGHCLTHTNPVAMPPPTPFVFATLGGRDVFPPLFYRAPRPLTAWIAANPRAPPAARI